MSKQEVLSILKENKGFVSGESISERLGISRAAVWKTVKLLRQEGYIISSKTNNGYSLEADPEVLEAEKIKAVIKDEAVRLHLIKSIDSTNNALKKMSLDGAPEGAVIVSDHQTAGRGRYGRSFASPKGKGIYVSMLLKPDSIEDIAGITCMTAVAVCRAIEKVTGLSPGIKWTNDIIFDRKKLCGILTELSSEGESGEIRYVVIGIGINVNLGAEDFPAELRSIAGSLYMAAGKTFDRSLLAGELINFVFDMYRDMPLKRLEYMDEYRRRCITLGRTVKFVRMDREYTALAENVEEDGALTVRLPDGEKLSIRFGEVSIVAVGDNSKL